MPDEAQPLTAAKPESASASAAKPAPSAPQAKNDTRGPIQHAASAPVDKPAEQQPRPKALPAERPQNAPVVRAPAGQPARSGSSNRVRARLARLGVQRANPYNPVLEPLLRIVRGNDPKIETATLRQIERAYQVAERWHRGQKRKSGDPYITHPLAVTTILAELGMDPATLMAGLLHDTVEDTEYGLEDLRRDFGDVVTLLVDGVTKLDKVKFGEAAQAETVRKMVVAMAKDPRVLVIKLADRLHNMRTMRYLKREKQEKKARETLEIYAPLAHRLGMNTIKWELEDLAFAILYPKMYDEIVRLVAERAPKRDEYLAVVTDEVQQDLRSARIKATVTGRPKHYYSVYQKMIVRGRDFAEIYDLVGIRVLVDTVRDCYAALGTVHARWNPVPGRFKDYIAMPKFNMYQSLHTTVIGPGGKPVELADPHLRHAPPRGVRHRRALEVQAGGRRRCLQGAHGRTQGVRQEQGRPPQRHGVAAPAARLAEGDGGPRRVPGVPALRPVPQRGLRLHAQGRRHSAPACPPAKAPEASGPSAEPAATPAPKPPAPTPPAPRPLLHARPRRPDHRLRHPRQRRLRPPQRLRERGLAVPGARAHPRGRVGAHPVLRLPGRHPGRGAGPLPAAVGRHARAVRPARQHPVGGRPDLPRPRGHLPLHLRDGRPEAPRATS
ncbi:hypothetical protein STENM223S_10049 [Streptomyces tendae]